MELALATAIGDSGQDRLRVTALATGHTWDRNARNQERDFMLLRNTVGGNLFQFFRMGRTDHGSEVTEASVPFKNLVCNGVEGARDIARVVTADNAHVLEIVGALVARTEQHVGTVLGILAHKRTDGIRAHPRRNRHRVGAVHIVGGRRIGGARLADITALGIEHHGDSCAPVSGNQFLEHKHRLHADAFVIGAVRFHDRGLHVTAQRAFQNLKVEALDLFFVRTCGNTRVDQLEDRVHPQANRVTALLDALF